jgi:hypothetical protein
MALKWADELSGSEPLPALESFYILAALELGDPDSGHDWLIEHAADFHLLWRQFRASMLPQSRDWPDGSTVLIQYMIWYERDSRRLKRGE